MKNVNIIPKAPQVRLHRNNTIAIRHTLCYAAALLGIVTLLIGCPDNMGDGGDNGTPTEDTLVQNAAGSAVSIDTIALSWALPTDTDGYLGVTISEENNSGSLINALELSARAIRNQVTGLEPATEYTFTIATRYTASGKNNSTTVTAMTTAATAVQNVAINTNVTTSNSVTIIWDNPEDTTDYTGVTISTATTVGNLDMGTPRIVDADTNTLTISGLAAETEYTFTLSFITAYSGGKDGSSSSYPITVTTQSNRVTNVAASDITEDSITLTWALPEDAGDDYQGVSITAEPTITEVVVDEPIITMVIDSLDAFTNYEFTITTRYSTANKSGGMITTAMIRTLSMNAIDRDGDTLVDINSLEALNNVRYNLDLGDTSDDGRYKDSTQAAVNAGLQCGADSTTDCTGYELMRSLDFTDAGSYDGSITNAMRDWRPNSMADNTGNTLPQTMAENATNAGWDPIGGEFATRFEGNGYTISNLYARNTDNSNGASIGLFNTIASAGTVRSIGLQNAALYGSNANFDTAGALAALNNGTIIASYAQNTIADSGAGISETIGGLIGGDTGTIIASYAHNTTANGGMGNSDSVGGLLGASNSSTTIASYASGAGTISGGTDNSDVVGGLIGFILNSSITVAAYSTNAVSGGSGNNDNIGGLVGTHNGTTDSSEGISASYATGVADGGTGTGDRAYALYGSRVSTVSNGLTDSYGFGIPVNHDGGSGGSNGSTPPAGVTAASDLTAANVPDSWNDADSDTLNAWDFGTAAQIPALRYADYDGPDNDDYHCGDDAIFTGIPTVAASPGGPIPVVCGETLLPGQRP